MIRIGLCAAPAGGKSTVARLLQQLGARWLNADEIGHQVLKMPAVVQRLVRRFGGTILAEDGEIDRRSLGKLVFGDDESAKAALNYLESITHPEIRSRLLAELAAAQAAGVPAVVLDVPLLFESQWHHWCDEIWFIDTARETVQAAAAGRGWTPQMLDQRMDRQLSVAEKRRRSTHVVPNQGDLDQLRAVVVAHWRRLFGSAEPARCD